MDSAIKGFYYLNHSSCYDSGLRLENSSDGFIVRYCWHDWRYLLPRRLLPCAIGQGNPAANALPAFKFGRSDIAIYFPHVELEYSFCNNRNRLDCD